MKIASFSIQIILFLILLLFIQTGCSNEKKASRQPAEIYPTGCRSCHDVVLDSPHDLACPVCHGGLDATGDKTAAHAGLVRRPAHPDNMAVTCGSCHQQHVNRAHMSRHFTLANEINLVRRAFGATEDIATFTDIPIWKDESTPLALADDLLRRRCLRCHLYSPGDAYPETTRGTGCAACHLHFEAGRMTDHTFVRLPSDSQCLHCHYGNWVGADYAGRFEHDFSGEYRTPFVYFDLPRPYGVEFHPLTPDIHTKAGLNCIDCHQGGQLMPGHSAEGKPQPLSCLSCHDLEEARKTGISNVHVEGGRIYVTARLTQKNLPAPVLSNPVHAQYETKADCTVCHAQWFFNDQSTHLLRLDTNDLESWNFIVVQGSAFIENAMNMPDKLGQDTIPSMPDAISGEARPGVWLKSFLQRRWEIPLIGMGADGVLHTYRPALDLTLSHVNTQGETILDNIRPDSENMLLPYTPHTIGKAGVFFKQRLTPDLSHDFIIPIHSSHK